VTAFYRRDGDTLIPSELTRGPWDPQSQHAGPPAALLGRAIEAPGTLVGRITVEILRPVPLAPLAVSSDVLRPGRNVELVGATLAEPGDERPIASATAWRLRTAATDPLPGPGEPPAGPGAGHERPFFPTGQEVGYHTAMDYRFVEGAFTEPGPARVWLRMRQPLVEGEPASPLARVLVAADSGNGVSAALDYRRWVFINTELTVHLIREPAGEWVQLDSITRVGPGGVGLAETVLWDESGRLGRAAQTLLVRPR
jgi:acyl-Coa thioesterase superfamily protein/acyl-CoA thioesterase superfamily protein